MHFPSDRDVNYFAQLTAERLTIKQVSGQKFRVWELPAGRANEACDCRVYAYAALCGLMHMGLKLNRRADEVTPSYAPPAPIPAELAAAMPSGAMISAVKITPGGSPTKRTRTSRLA